MNILGRKELKHPEQQRVSKNGTSNRNFTHTLLLRQRKISKAYYITDEPIYLRVNVLNQLPS